MGGLALSLRLCLLVGGRIWACGCDFRCWVLDTIVASVWGGAVLVVTTGGFSL